MSRLTIIFVLSMIIVITGGLFSHAYAESEIPSWLKHVANWWGDSIIDDTTFLKLTEYLVNEGIIEAPLKGPTQITGDVQVPVWIKNSASWWGQGQISDDDFMSTIEYLGAQKLIGITSQQSISLSNSYEIQKIPTPVGLKVVWTNNDFQSHTIAGGTIDNADEFFDSGIIQSDQSFSFVFKKEGSYPYFCMIHPWESDVLVVTSSELTMFYEEKIRLEEEMRLEEERKKQEEYERQQKENERIVSETVIMNPKDVSNSEFYDINTECQLKYFFYKDPAKTSEIISMIIQSKQQVEQKYFERAGYTQNPDVMREIIAEITMEHYSINPILKDITIISGDELSQKEIQQIQQGTHPCEEEFELYPFGEGANNFAFTAKTFFEDTPISGAEIGQWVKYQFKINTGSDENLRDLMNKQLSSSLSGANFDLGDVEWLKREVIDISGNEITIQDEYKVRGKTSLFTDTITRDFTNYPLTPLFIPTNVEKGNILFRDYFFGDFVVADFQKRNYGGKNVDTIPLIASIEFNQAGEFVESNFENYYDKKTGMLLEGQMAMQAATFSEGFDVDIQIKAIDFHIPSATLAVEGGGCLIATATYGTELAPQVQQLREIRDNTLLETESGSAFMESFNQFYYSFSPTVADWERENPVFKETVKIAITPLLTSLSILNYVDMDSEETVLGYGVSLILLNIGMYFVAPVIGMMKIRDLYKNRYERST